MQHAGTKCCITAEGCSAELRCHFYLHSSRGTVSGYELVCLFDVGPMKDHTRAHKQNNSVYNFTASHGTVPTFQCDVPVSAADHPRVRVKRSQDLVRPERRGKGG